MYQNVSTVAPFAGLPSTGARPAITSWYSPSLYSMCPFRTAPMLRSARAASVGWAATGDPRGARPEVGGGAEAKADSSPASRLAHRSPSVGRGGEAQPRFADDGQEGGRPTSPGNGDLPDRRRAERLRPLFQFIKVSMLKSNGQKTQEIEVRKKQSSN
jgi:hypothetical protein